MTALTELNDRTFDKFLSSQPKGTLVVVDFWADWCGPCKQLTPKIEQFAAKLAADGRTDVVFTSFEAGTDQHPSTAVPSRFGITNMPVVMVFRAGDPDPIKDMRGDIKAVLPGLRKALEA